MGSHPARTTCWASSAPLLGVARPLSSAFTMSLFWKGFCPKAEQCTKRGRCIACNEDREAVVLGVANHLYASNYHYMEWEVALTEADNEAGFWDIPSVSQPPT